MLCTGERSGDLLWRHVGGRAWPATPFHWAGDWDQGVWPVQEQQTSSTLLWLVSETFSSFCSCPGEIWTLFLFSCRGSLCDNQHENWELWVVIAVETDCVITDVKNCRPAIEEISTSVALCCYVAHYIKHFVQMLRILKLSNLAWTQHASCT